MKASNEYVQRSNGTFIDPNDADKSGIKDGTVTELDFKSNPKPYKVYIALITQSGTSAPTATVLENTLGTITLSRLTTGIYYINSSALFATNKTFISPIVGSTINGTNIRIETQQQSTSQLLINATSGGSQSDGLLINFPIEIRVYP